MIGILGAGAFGRALSSVQADAHQAVVMWGRNVSRQWRTEAFPRPAPVTDLALPETVPLTSRIGDVDHAEVLLLAIPAQAAGAFLWKYAKSLPRVPMVLCAKGIEAEGLRLQTEVAAEYWPAEKLAVLSGPGFANEIATNLPTALTLASPDRDLGRALQQKLSTPRFRLYLSQDVVGVQLGGALKNVIALACGMVDGAGLGASARSALMTRGFAEMARLATAMGGRLETLTGLSGLGDLSLTCNSPQSRNYAAGRAIGAGEDRPDGTIEGIHSARAACRLAERHAVEMPIAKAVADVLEGAVTVSGAMDSLLSRRLRDE